MPLNATTKVDKLRRAARQLARRRPGRPRQTTCPSGRRLVPIGTSACRPRGRRTLPGEPRWSARAVRNGSDGRELAAKRLHRLGPGGPHLHLGIDGHRQGRHADPLEHRRRRHLDHHYLENTTNDVILNVLPLSFDYGLYQLLMAFKLGATLVLERSFTYPGAVLERIGEEGSPASRIVPTIAALLLQTAICRRHSTSAHCATSRTPRRRCRVSHIERLRKLFPAAKLYSMYGLTECKRVTYLPPEQLDIRPDSIGTRHADTKKCTWSTTTDTASTSGVGELVVRGAHVMAGLLGDARGNRPGAAAWPIPRESASCIRATCSASTTKGILYFVGRKDDIIKTRGEKVSPKEVENALCGCEGIAEAAVVGVPDEILGHAVKAVVTLAAGSRLTERDIMRYCADHLEDFMVPRIIEIRPLLPKTGSGKIDKLELKTTGLTR